MRLGSDCRRGAAGLLRGTSYPTQDVDLLVRDTPLNRRKLRALAKALGGSGPGEISGLSNIERIYGAEVQPDILYERMSGTLRFASVKSRAHTEKVEFESLLVASLEDVIKSKRAAGRAKDLLALPDCEATLAENSGCPEFPALAAARLEQADHRREMRARADQRAGVEHLVIAEHARLQIRLLQRVGDSA